MIFAAAMAFLEAAVVVYLRRIAGVVEPWRDPSVYDAGIAAIEVGREAATLVMLAALGWACGRSATSRAGFALFGFGAWDLLYYVWLKVLLGWPASLLTPDILFLIPLPWWGPVIAPVLVALLMAGAGAGMIALDDRGRSLRPGSLDALLMASGVALILYVFMSDAIAALPATAEALSRVRPGEFRWGIYFVGLLLAGIGIGRPIVSAGRSREAGRAREAGAPRG